MEKHGPYENRSENDIRAEFKRKVRCALEVGISSREINRVIDRNDKESLRSSPAVVLTEEGGNVWAYRILLEEAYKAAGWNGSNLETEVDAAAREEMMHFNAGIKQSVLDPVLGVALSINRDGSKRVVPFFNYAIPQGNPLSESLSEYRIAAAPGELMTSSDRRKTSLIGLLKILLSHV